MLDFKAVLKSYWFYAFNVTFPLKVKDWYKRGSKVFCFLFKWQNPLFPYYEK